MERKQKNYKKKLSQKWLWKENPLKKANLQV